jgi:beta-glucosidase
MRSRRRGKSSILVAVLAATVACLAAGLAPAGATTTPATTTPATAGTSLVSQLVQAMTLDEKLGMVNGWPDGVSPPPTTDRLIGVGFIPGVPRLGIPALTFTDGPAGVRMNLPTTAMPAPVALAATFSAVRPGPGPGLASPGPRRHLRPDAEHRAGAAGRPELRDPG